MDTCEREMWLRRSGVFRLKRFLTRSAAAFWDVAPS